MSPLISRPGLMDITPYAGGESEIKGQSRVIKLASNEGALGPSPKAIKAYQELAPRLHRYPDGNSTNLRRALAEKHSIDAERIVCGAGSDEILGLLARAYAGPGDEIIHTEHGFLMYPIIAKAIGATPVAAPEEELCACVDQILAKVTEKTRIVFIANPNNPTGTFLDKRQMKRLRSGLREDILMVIDAAYAEFMDRDDYSPGIDLVDAGDNTVMTRTFSKIYALSSLRLGWAYCPKDVAGVLNRVRNPFNVCAPALAAGLAALGDGGFLERSRAHNAKWMRWSANRLCSLGLEAPESFGNFILAHFPDTPGRTAADADVFLRSKGIIVRRMLGYGLPKSLRVTIGTEDEMRTFTESIKEFMTQ